MRSLKGKLLIAVPRLPDVNFYRSVVLILRHDDQGALGLVLNRPTEVLVSELWKNVSNQDSDTDEFSAGFGDFKLDIDDFNAAEFDPVDLEDQQNKGPQSAGYDAEKAGANSQDAEDSENSNSEISDNSYVCFGGPVPGPLMALHCSFSLAENDVIPGVFYSVRKTHIAQLISTNRDPLKIFSGHSGWGPGQLDAEIEVGGWLVMDAEYQHIFEADEELWKTTCEHFGNEILIKDKYRSNIPHDPSCN